MDRNRRFHRPGRDGPTPVQGTPGRCKRTRLRPAGGHFANYSPWGCGAAALCHPAAVSRREAFLKYNFLNSSCLNVFKVVYQRPIPKPIWSIAAGMREEIGILIKHELETLLKFISLENGSGVAEVDAFSFRFGSGHFPLAENDADPCGSTVSVPAGAKWESLASYQDMEPRLPMIGRFLRQLLRLGQFEYEGRPVPVMGFRLKNLACWAKYPCLSLFDNFSFECITSSCSCHCEFCFLDGLGPRRRERRQLTMREARTRAKYFSAEKKAGLPVPATFPGEPLLHPQFLDFLRMARESDPTGCFFFTTNGDFLTPETVEQLAELKPMVPCISLNSADLATRTKVMRSKRSQTAIEAIPLLREKGIPYLGSIVASPSFGLDDIAATARFYDRHSALVIRLLLPGYTRFQPPAAWFDTDHWWGEIVRLGRSLRAELTTPILMQPNFYWDHDIAARIDGVYRNSPAERAGLRLGDLILEVDGKPIFAKAEIVDAFKKKEEPRPASRIVKYRRGEEEFTAGLANDLGIDDDYYPYKPRGYKLGVGAHDAPCLGMHVAQGFRLEYLRFLKKCVEKHPGTGKLLIFTTPLVKSHLAQALDLVEDMPECRLENVEARITVAPQRYWGGNIMVGDINVSQDYIEHLQSLQECGYRPDLVIIPRSFVNPWGFDVAGKSYTDIERHTGIPVELLGVEQIMW